MCKELAATRTCPPPRTPQGCEECLKGPEPTWMHLRICEKCGHVGCCDSSPNQHARKHHESSGHPCITSYEPGETWDYCYVHDQERDPAPPGVRKQQRPEDAVISPEEEAAHKRLFAGAL